MAKVRLTQQQIKDIKDSVNMVIPDAKVLIFGSRTDLTKKGGDIDIAIFTQNELTNPEKFKIKMEILKNLYKKLGERKIDLIVISKNPKKEIEKIALQTGIEI
ncbi:nucleotidyltransferase domain-containing protein [Sulfurihydrogenibium sp.]|uniref:nucleotidyltransferase domain-containing protein n=1 Tax=Sulfurihydrogenibium sp. TaxID=2053621 RepID=UPI00260B5B1C|nr:nucleotidyltransferase domain-containing protein [Sulfurihydrogenibium sp.]